jgi:hypothetical protein
MLFVFESRLPVLLVAAITGTIFVQPNRAIAQWWSRAPADFEDCADVAERSATKEEKTAALAQCNAKFAGRRKLGGGYVYYDFMQDRSFDIAGPNPTPDEQKYIDQQYTFYLEKQRNNNVTAALVARPQLQQPLPASLRDDSEKPPIYVERVPIPMQRPSKPQVAANTAASNEARAHAKGGNCPKDTPKDTFSCNWPVLSEKLSELKKLFNTPAAPPASKAKKG